MLHYSEKNSYCHFDPLPYLISAISTLATFSSASKCVSSVELHMSLWFRKLQGVKRSDLAEVLPDLWSLGPHKSLNLYQQCVRLHKIDFVAFIYIFFLLCRLWFCLSTFRNAVIIVIFLFTHFPLSTPIFSLRCCQNSSQS